MTELRGRLIQLRPLQLDDLDALVEQSVWATASEDQRAEVSVQLRRMIERRLTLAENGFLALAIERAGSLVGDLQVRAPHNAFPPGVCELGITVFRDVRAQGIGTDAVTAITEHLLADGWQRIQAATALTNTAMRRVLEHAGYRYEGVLRSFAPGGAFREDYAMYAILPTDRAQAASADSISPVS